MPSFVEISSFSRSEVKKLTKSFSCKKHTSLLEYIRQFAYKHSKEGLYRTYLLEIDGTYCAYISISLATVQNRDDSFSKIKDITQLQQNLSYAVPALKITRLCVFDQMQGKGIGSIMMTFAEILSMQTQAKTGCKIEIVDAKKDAITFYENAGFEQVNLESEGETTLMIKKVVTPHELKGFEKDERLRYLRDIKEFCAVFELVNEYNVIEKYYEANVL